MLLAYPNSSNANAVRRTVYTSLGAIEAALLGSTLLNYATGTETGMADQSVLIWGALSATFLALRCYFLFVRPE